MADNANYQEKVLTILKGEAFSPIGTFYRLDSIEAVAELVKAKGSKEHTVIFYNDDQIDIILDDSIMDRPRDTAVYGFKPSDLFIEWNSILDKPISQKDFVNFLKQRTPKELADLGMLLAKVQNLKIATQIMGDYQYDDNNNFTVMYKAKDGEGQVTLPSILEVTIPILYGSDKNFALEIELELNKPRSENEKPSFTLSCRQLKRYIREATEYEVERLKTMLPGYLILAGAAK